MMNNGFSLQLFNMHLEEHLQEDSFLLQALLLVLLVLTTYAVHKKSQSKKRLNVVRNRPSSAVEKQKIIVACELEELFVTMSDCKRPGFHKINVRCSGLAHLLVKIKELFGIGIYYKPKTSVRNLKTFLQPLADNPKVQLFLYTTLTLRIAEQIIQKLCLKTFFTAEHQRSCNDGYSEPLKHPTEVDFNTKRVIIVTGSKTDHLEEDSKYFLVVKRKELNDCIKIINRIINKNEDIDELHNELGEVKAQIESDYE